MDVCVCLERHPPGVFSCTAKQFKMSFRQRRVAFNKAEAEKGNFDEMVIQHSKTFCLSYYWFGMSELFI